MPETFADAVTRYAEAHVDAAGVARTPLPGVMIFRAIAPSGIDCAIPRPLIALVVQGRKEVSFGASRLTLKAGDTLLVSADVPTASRIVEASPTAPYCSFIVELEPAIIAELSTQMEIEAGGEGGALSREPTRFEVADAALRLMRLFDRPAALPVLVDQILRELHYWLLVGPEGPAIRRLGLPDGQAARITRAVKLLRSEFDRPLRIEKLADHAGMSSSAFHQHFRAVTSLSPLQFQKQLRLIEARRLMLGMGMTASAAAYAVGYESVPQFTREYGRMFGNPPARDVSALRSQVAGVA